MQKELEKYIRSSVSAINNGLKDTSFKVSGDIEFDLAIVNTTEGGGGLKIYVAKAEGKLKSEEINHIKLRVKKDGSTVSVYKPTNAGFNNKFK